VRLVVQLLWSARWLLVTALGASIAGGLGGAVQIALIHRALTSVDTELSSIGWKFAGMSVLVMGVRWVSQIQFVRAGQALLANLRRSISHSVAEVSYARLEELGAGRLLAVLSEDINAVGQWLVSLPRLVMNAAIVAGCLGYLALLSIHVFALALVIVAVGSVGYHLVHSKALALLRASRAREDDLFGHFRALFDGAKELKLHAPRRREFLSSAVDESIEATRQLRTRGMTLNVVAASSGNFLLFVLIGTVIFVLSPALGERGGVLSGYAFVLLYMMLPLEALLDAIPAIGRAQVALERIGRTAEQLPLAMSPLDSNARETGARAAQAVSAAAPGFRSLQLRKVTRRYQQQHSGFTLGPLDLELQRGEIVFLVGGNGGGKTTLAKTLVGLYPPDSGELLLNGKRVEDAEREQYRQQFSAVFSDFFVFDRLLGVEGTGLDARARQLLSRLELDRRVSVNEGTFSTTKLSAGQRKRLALLVAYLEDRAVYVFDEWAADQDPRFKDTFYRELLPELKARGKAVLVITHDDRYFSLADRCIKLDSGCIVNAPAASFAPAPERAEKGNEPALGPLLLD
jgi:putative ATP-binding cassette transporter